MENGGKKIFLRWLCILKHRTDAYFILSGDLMCMGGAFLYGLSNVAEEYAVKTIDCVEFLAMIGLFGSVINGVQLYALAFMLIINWRAIILINST